MWTYQIIHKDNLLKDGLKNWQHVCFVVINKEVLADSVLFVPRIAFEDVASQTGIDVVD
jgi:hypothetical protein